MSKLNEAKESVGELIITGFTGLDLSDESSAFLTQAKIGGVILFSKNFENPAQLAELVNSLQQGAPKTLPRWIAVDQEGGRTQRFKAPFTKIPAAISVGRTDSPKLTFELSEMVARELAASGINLNLAPVADIAGAAGFLLERSFGSSEDLVSKMVTAWVRGHLLGGVSPCAKHFPGHGATTQDSHDHLPRVGTARADLLSNELRPFIKAMKSKCPFIMPAHVIYESIDAEFPATLSSKVLRDLLRTELRFNHLVISDDLEMKAITLSFKANEVPFLALKAGCDLLLYKTEPAARSAWQALQKALDDGLLSPDLVIETAARIQDAKREQLLPYKRVDLAEISKKVGVQSHEELAQKFV